MCFRFWRRGGGLGLLTQGVDDHAQHLFFGSGFAGENLELACTLLDEHFDAGDDRNTFLARETEQRGFEWVVDQVEDKFGVEVFGFENLVALDAGHADGGRVDDGVEGGLGDCVLLDGLGAGLTGQFLCSFASAIEDEDLSTFIPQAEDGGARGSACAEDEDLGSAEGDALFERAGDAGDVGIEAVELAVLRAEDGVTGADLCGERIGLFEVRHDLLLERHGDRESLDGDFVNQLQEIGEFRSLEREIDGVDGLAAEGGVHHDGRERAADRVASDAVDFGGVVNLIDAIGFDEGTRGDLTGAGLFADAGGGEGEGGAGAETEDAGDNAGVAHADADDVGVVFHALDETHEGDVIGERLGGGDDLDEVGLEGNDAFVDAFEVFGGGEVVMADDEAAPFSRSFWSSPFFMTSADSSSTSTMWKPEAAALERISISSGTLPGNLPPLTVRRQVAMAVTALLSVRKCLSLGKARRGFSR